MTDETQQPAADASAKTREQEMEEHMSGIHNALIDVLREKGATDEQAIAIMTNILANWITQGQAGKERVARLVHIGNAVQNWVIMIEQQEARTQPQIIVVGDGVPFPKKRNLQ